MPGTIYGSGLTEFFSTQREVFGMKQFAACRSRTIYDEQPDYYECSNDVVMHNWPAVCDSKN